MSQCTTETSLLSSSDLSGTLLESTQPIGVFSGNNFVPALPEMVLIKPVHLVEQLTPVTDWGSVFYLIPLPNTEDGFTYRIMTSTPNNDVTIRTSDSTSTRTISLQNKGSVSTLTQSSSQYVTIRSTSPVLVAQFAGGTYDDG